MSFSNSLHLLLVVVQLVGIVTGQWYFPENGKGFLSAGCTNWYASGNHVLTATW